MKKRFILFAVITLLLTMIIYYSPNTSADSESVIVTGEIVNVREKPDTSYSIVTQVRKGETYPVVSVENGWYQIKLPSGQEGWVAGWLVDKQTITSSSTTSGTVSASSLNVRSEPSSTSSKVGTLEKGERVKILDDNNGWSQIEFNGNVAWVSSQYIETSNSEPVSSVVSSPNQINILYDATNIRKKPTLKSKIVKQASSGDIFTVLEKDGDWFKIEYSPGKTGYVASWIVSANQAGQINNFKEYDGAKTIVIDPGHGGRDQGATGTSGVLEKDLTLRIGNTLAKKLNKAGYNVILTRSTEEYISLEERTKQAQISGADAFISLHYDSIDNNEVEGHTSYYYHDRDQKLAEAVHNNITDAVMISDRGVRFGDYYVLRENTQPSVLLELGYLSNPHEEEIIKSVQYQEKVANAILEGINQYFGN
ncbi:N-acetylmuramoyl-L-alanine amidase [Bacillus niameyensis]|uniref:N-acetylmuramoyl-L-alanine amidase n=1 Tax=Bacillus niameyensis TaxID=1522308 RepID=UPI00078620C6|nr:N-acetylmuramoyl-L-alanine amidase [Bacillus niameyensis]